MLGTFLIIAGIVLLLVTAFVAKPLLKRRRRAALMAEPFPDAWDAILRKRFRLDRDLPDPLRSRLRQHMQVFISEKYFEPCGDLKEITDEMRVLVAAQACLLLIGLKKHDFFRKLRSILMYPRSFRDRGRRRFDLREDHASSRGARLGESWTTGSVILSWESVKQGAANDDDGMNVVLHEFAHQLDQADGTADGVPILSKSSEYRTWAEVFKADYEDLVEDANNPRSDPLLDTYGAENPAEFFAVATETFFEQPEDLRDEHPLLYRELQSYYGLDPAGWES